MVNHFHRADGHTKSVAVAIGINDGQHLFYLANLGIGSRTPLFVNHTTLTIDVVV